MFKYHTQKMEMYYEKVVEMHQKGCSPSTISKKINLDSDTIRRWIRNFAAENKPNAPTMKNTEVADNKMSEHQKENIDKRTIYQALTHHYQSIFLDSNKAWDKQLSHFVDWKTYKIVSRTKARHKVLYLALKLNPAIFRLLIRHI